MFERAYSPAPLTLPSHATMFTGLYPQEHGLRTNGRGRLDSSIPTLPELAANAGYDTAAFVASFVLDSKFGLDRGFKTYDDDLSTAEPADEAIHRQRAGQLVVDSALAWLKQPRSGPFFCWVHLYDPHYPYLDHKQEFGDQFVEPYDAEIAYVDRQIGRLLNHLKSAGVDDQTLIVIVGDHGEGLAEHVERTHGYTLYNSTQHVPLILRLKGGMAPGHRVSQSVPLVDITPTLIDLLRLKSPGPITGRSLQRALSGKSLDERLCFSATDDPFLQNGWSPLQSVVAGDWKYIRTTKPELYNLRDDPGELRNLAGIANDRQFQMERILDDLQKTLVPRKTTAVQLSANERRALEGLGYIGGTQQHVHSSTMDLLPDIKDMLKYDYATQDAQNMLHSGNVDDAIKMLKTVVDESPAHLSAKLFLGEALQNKGQLQEAMALYQAVLEKKPDHIDGVVHLGLAYIEQGRVQESITQFDRAVQIDPESTIAHYNLGLALARNGQIDEAIAHFREVIFHDPGFVNVHTALGNALIANQQNAEAIQSFKQELQVSPQAVEARVNLAVLLNETDPAAALAYLQEAVKFGPENAQVQYNLGAFLLQRGHAAEAVPYLAESLRLMPTHPRAKSQLERARRLTGDKP